MITVRLALTIAPLLALALAGCGSNTSGTGGGGAGGQTSTTTGSICASDPRVTSYAVGASAAAMDGKVKVTFVDAQPAPPAKGSNAWTIDLTDDAGQPIEGATISLKPFMPDHGHGATVIPAVKPGSQAGRYVVDQIELFMPGVWQSTFTITPSGGAPDTVVFTFCVDG
ncbi:MAG: FixH family protein [Minicystis sp.]